MNFTRQFMYVDTSRLNMWIYAADSSCRQSLSVGQGRRSMLTTFINAEKQFVALKRFKRTIKILYDPRFFVIDVFLGAE